jgi:hypothetical protein
MPRGWNLGETNRTLHPMVQCRGDSNLRAEEGAGRQMVRLKAPKRLWDECLELEAYLCSRIAHKIYRLDGQVPETLVSVVRPLTSPHMWCSNGTNGFSSETPP